MTSKSDKWRSAIALLCGIVCLSVASGEESAADPLVFEDDIFPILEAKCFSCHGADAREANLDLRTIGAIRRGGDSGSANEGGEESVLMERIASGEMPPEDSPALSKDETDQIRKWLAGGSVASKESTDAWTQRLEAGKRYWAFQPPVRPDVPGRHAKTNEYSASLLGERYASLQAWYRGDGVAANENGRVIQWADESGHQRHLRPTAADGDSQVGAAPLFLARSTIGGKAAVRFDDFAGLGSPAHNPVDVQGDAAWTIAAVLRIQQPNPTSHTSVIIGFGDPAPGHNPGRPWASLLEVHRGSSLLSHSGGYGHDARMQPQTIGAFYDRPVVLTVVKRPGPMARTTSLFINGRPVAPSSLVGASTVPDIRHREDFGVYIGRAHGSLGAFRGDVAEVAVFNTALDDDRRASLERELIERYELEPDHPIDAFLNQQLTAGGLSPAPLADRRTLIRRAYFDLIGLPPKPEEVEAFVSDPVPFAWERLIGRLLDSKHYGERWGRHWLDVARYADTGGYETDIYFRNAWRFRDYVVKSFNDDKPYDQFVQEQVAGDEIWPDNLDLDGSYAMDPEKLRHFEALTGTGFYALGPQVHESNMDAKKLTNERLTDWVDTTASAFMGLTFACARCHDHKFDPISQRDYYSLQAVFAGSREVEVPIQHGMGLADWKQHYPKVIALEEARKAYRAFEKQTSGRQRTPEESGKLQSLKNTIADRLLALPETDAQRTPYAGIYERPTIAALAHHRPELAPEVRLLSRGELGRPKQAMTPALPGILAHQTGADPALPPLPSGGRKALALWLTRPDHPLTARVMVNRIWQWHFGRGIVATANDFGRMGTPPTHPELLDWLATEFVAGGWSVKSMHRLIMTSDAYRRASDFYSDDHGRLDPDNVLLWRMNRRRLEGEAVWDAVHSVAGTINLSLGGRPVMPPLVAEELTNKANWVASELPSDHTRRGLYIIVRRNFNFPLFDLFDAPVNAVSCSGRDVSTVAPQALWLLNNQHAFGQAQRFAARLVREAGADREAQIRLAWRLAFARPPSNDEVQESLALLEALRSTASHSVDVDSEGPSPAEGAALAQFCLTLFNVNEFIYVD